MTPHPSPFVPTVPLAAPQPLTAEASFAAPGLASPAGAGTSPAPRLPRVDAHCAGLRMTPAEFDAIEEHDDCYEYELIEGVLVVNPIPGEGEVDSNEELGRWLRNYRESHPQGTALDATLSERYISTPGTRRKADRVVWTGLGRRVRPKIDLPSIAVEFVSRSRRDWLRDYVEKRDEYLAAGVREYWIIDRFRRRFTVFRAEGDAVVELTVGPHEVYTTPLLPGFELSFAKLLEVADRWSEEPPMDERD